MLEIIYTNQFKRDVKLMQRCKKSTEKLKVVIVLLSQNKLLEDKYKDHVLIGNYKGRRECHVEPDWLLVYKLQEESIIFERTGTHADLFR